MTKELDYYRVDGSIGWNQEWFQDWSMYDGGCAAVTACDLCIQLARQKGINALYPYDHKNLTRNDYLAFATKMKPYLHPRWQGIDTLGLYISGLSSYWHEAGVDSIKAEGVSGTVPLREAQKRIREQIDGDMIVPYLMLYHKNRSLNDFQWHWFNLAGYEEFDGEFYVKAVTYGNFYWLNLQELWNTGYRRKGGIICVTA